MKIYSKSGFCLSEWIVIFGVCVALAVACLSFARANAEANAEAIAVARAAETRTITGVIEEKEIRQRMNGPSYIALRLQGLPQVFVLDVDHLPDPLPVYKLGERVALRVDQKGVVFEILSPEFPTFHEVPRVP